jgi:hypothetical protein
MINNRFETQAEIYQALLDGKKIVHSVRQQVFCTHEKWSYVQ